MCVDEVFLYYEPKTTYYIFILRNYVRIRTNQSKWLCV